MLPFSPVASVTFATYPRFCFPAFSWYIVSESARFYSMDAMHPYRRLLLCTGDNFRPLPKPPVPTACAKGAGNYRIHHRHPRKVFSRQQHLAELCLFFRGLITVITVDHPILIACFYMMMHGFRKFCSCFRIFFCKIRYAGIKQLQMSHFSDIGRYHQSVHTLQGKINFHKSGYFFTL